jgi:hypothetical protein
MSANSDRPLLSGVETITAESVEIVETPSAPRGGDAHQLSFHHSHIVIEPHIPADLKPCDNFEFPPGSA